jgi:hypothetical protein
MDVMTTNQTAATSPQNGQRLVKPDVARLSKVVAETQPSRPLMM